MTFCLYNALVDIPVQSAFRYVLIKVEGTHALMHFVTHTNVLPLFSARRERGYVLLLIVDVALI